MTTGRGAQKNGDERGDNSGKISRRSGERERETSCRTLGNFFLPASPWRPLPRVAPPLPAVGGSGGTHWKERRWPQYRGESTVPSGYLFSYRGGRAKPKTSRGIPKRTPGGTFALPASRTSSLDSSGLSQGGPGALGPAHKAAHAKRGKAKHGDAPSGRVRLAGRSKAGREGGTRKGKRMPPVSPDKRPIPSHRAVHLDEGADGHRARGEPGRLGEHSGRRPPLQASCLYGRFKEEGRGGGGRGAKEA